MQLIRSNHERGDTLVEVTIALAILSMTLMGATQLAIRAFQQGQTARQRTALSLTAQQQLEHLRTFRDTHSWSEFLNGAGDGSFAGVLSAHTGGTCKTVACFTMAQQGSRYVPVDGGTSNGTVPGSYLEIHSVAAGADMVRFTVDWGFPNASGGPMATGHVVTQMSNLTAAVPTPAPTPSACVNNSDIAFVIDMSHSMTYHWYDDNDAVAPEPNRFSVLIPLLTQATGILNNIGIAPGGNQGAIIRFSGDGGPVWYRPEIFPAPELAQNLTTNIPSLISKVDQQSDFTPQEATRYRAALGLAKTTLQAGRPAANKAVVFISDGYPDDVDWFWNAAPNEAAVRAYVDSEIFGTGIKVYTVGIQPGVAVNPVLQYMANRTGGTYYPINTAAPGSQAQFDAALQLVADFLSC